MVRLDQLLKAAGEPTRLRILNLLRRGSICVCDLQVILGVPQPTVSRHLASLRHAGLVEDVRDGTRVLYSLAPATTPQIRIVQILVERGCACDEVLQDDLKRLKRLLRKGECSLVSMTIGKEKAAKGDSP